MKKIIAFFLLAVSCKSVQTLSHLPAREDGFYYRVRNKDLGQYLHIYTNGKLVINDLLVKEEERLKRGPSIMCALDTAAIKKFEDMSVCTYKLKKDSLFFKRKSYDPLVRYTAAYSCKIYKDSIVAKIKPVDYDTNRVKIKRELNVTFKFVRATCDPNLKIPPRDDYEVDDNRLLHNE